MTKAQQIMDPTRLEAVRASLPILEDDDANTKLHADEVVWYDNTSMPATYQHQNGNGRSFATFHSPAYNISADPSDRGRPGMGNGNNEFPWVSGKPGGAHIAAGVKSVKGFYFPKPAAVFNKTVAGRAFSNNQTIIYDWVFADGTIFYEAIYQRIRDEDVVFELRTRTKSGQEWDVDIFRPYATAEDVASILEEMGPGERRAEAIAHLRSEKTLPVMRLADDFHTRERAFEATSEVYNLPLIKTDDVIEILSRPFVSCLGIPFKAKAYAPSNDTEYVSLVPPNYHGAFVHSTGTSQDCMQCHDSSGDHVTRFQLRGWYGRIMGSASDKILSWHPIEPASISYNGGARQVRLRQSFVDNGLVVFVRDRLPDGYQYTKVD